VAVSDPSGAVARSVARRWGVAASPTRGRSGPTRRYAARFIAERLGQVRSFNAWYRIGDLRPGIEATLFPPVVAEPAAGRREAALAGTPSPPAAWVSSAM
jgi:hypothetical protein